MKLPIDLRKDSGIPIYVQFEEQMRALIRSGTLKPGMPIPTVRETAVDMAINYNTVARIYRDLQREGFLSLRRGVGTFVAELVPPGPARPEKCAELEQHIAQLVDLARKKGFQKSDLINLVRITWNKQD